METIKELNLEELEQVNGGEEFIACTVIGIANNTTASACIGYGIGLQGENIGLGAATCAFLGFGIAYTTT